MGNEFRTYADILKKVGVPLGRTAAHRVSQDAVTRFGELTGDCQWIHVDAERARDESPFGGPIVHGAFTLALVPVLAMQLATFPDANLVVNVGIERARLRSPLLVGDQIVATGRVKDVQRMGESDAAVTFAMKLDSVESSSAVCAANQMFLVKGI